jgi:hypothetical protein
VHHSLRTERPSVIGLFSPRLEKLEEVAGKTGRGNILRTDFSASAPISESAAILLFERMAFLVAFTA